jgi:hypothetical protein
MASRLFCSFREVMGEFGCRGGKLQDQGHYLEGLLRELGVGLSIRCQL